MAQPPQQASNQPQTGGAQPPNQGAQLPQQALSPDQIRKMQVMSKQAMSLLLEDATSEQIVKSAKAGDPQQVVADLVVTLLGRLYEAAKAAGQMGDGPEDMVTLMVTGVQIIGDLTEMLIAAGVLQESQAQQFVATVTKMAIDKHNSSLQGGGQQPAQPQGAMQ